MTEVLPRIAFVALGGTIDLRAAHRLDHVRYYERAERVDPADLLADVGEIAELSQVDVVTFERSSAAGLLESEWLRLANQVERLVDAGYDGVVITHGTNTLEETAYFLDLVITTATPVVVVGAMRPAGSLGTDGQLNLLRAFQVAVAPEARGHGVLVVLDETIHSARDVAKTATLRVGAFRSNDVGPVGYADADGEVVFYHRSLHRRGSFAGQVPFETGDQLPRVDLVVSYVGADELFIDAAVAAGARGLVSAGMGAGRPTPAEQTALDRAGQAGVVVCQASRVGSGRVPRHQTSPERVMAGNLSPFKARIALALALRTTSDVATIQAMFDEL